MNTNSKYNKAVAIVPSDTVNFVSAGKGASGDALLCDAIYVGGAGVVALVQQDGTVANFTCVAGALLPFTAKRVNSTNTTATLMQALYLI
jgi:hypothetical protein